ncbi:hypothetical protein G6F65_018483 [Rhizopus arrhizus]|nr:hypothetical protein G6F65_018483 [Rhizopus arrhizus]
MAWGRFFRRSSTEQSQHLAVATQVAVVATPSSSSTCSTAAASQPRPFYCVGRLKRESCPKKTAAGRTPHQPRLHDRQPKKSRDTGSRLFHASSDSAEEFLHAVRPGLALRRVAVAPVVQRGLELAQDALLVFAQAHRRFHDNVAVQVTRIAAPHAADALAAQAEGLARLRAFGNRDLGFAAQRGHLKLAAQRRRGERDGRPEGRR